VEDRVGTAHEVEMVDAMVTSLEEIGAPRDLLERVGLS
jgi:hypothetical protein